MSNKISEEKLAWVKDILQRKPRKNSPEPELVGELNNSLDTFPFDFSEDLYKILQESRLRRKQNMPKVKMNEENKENFSSQINKLNEHGIDLLRNEKKSLNVTTGNDSFLYFEKICDKSVSDPNSTIHSYVSQMKERNQNSINLSEITEENVSNDECAAIHRLLNENDITVNTAAVLKERAKKYKKKHSLNLNDETQLGDIEPPTLFWDITNVDDDGKISPTKRVDLRFSTILEESNLSDDINSLTFQTANQQISTSYDSCHQESTNYETANETFSQIGRRETKEFTLSKQSSQINEAALDTIEILDDSIEELNSNRDFASEPVENNALNDDDTLVSIENESYKFNISREFNDTLEEVEYIMQQGAKYMAQNGTKPKIISDIQLKVNHPTKPIKTPIKTPSKESVFKKPASAISTKTTPHSKKRFANIVSPVGAYIKRTPETPIYTTVKHTTVQSEIKPFDYAEIARRIQYMPIDDRNPQITKKTNVECSLPKKGYVSSSYYNIKDERTPIVIPGGDKIHRYLGPALMPQVIRHDGKAKIDFPKDLPKKIDDVNSTVDSSLADLSVMSGNVSFYTIKDAQNFASNKPKINKKFF